MVGLTTPATAIAAAAACALSGLGIWRKGGDRNASFSPEQVEAESAPASIGDVEAVTTTQQPAAVSPSEKATGGKRSEAVEGSPKWISDAIWIAVVVDVVAVVFALGVCGARRVRRSRKAPTEVPNRNTSRPASAAVSPPRHNSTSPSKKVGSTEQENLAEEEAQASDIAARAAPEALAGAEAAVEAGMPEKLLAEEASKTRVQKKVLVTGGGGLLGRQIIPELVSRGFAVENVSSRPWSNLHPEVQRLFRILGVYSHELDLEADIRENKVKGLRALLERGGFDLVVNLVADRGGVKYDRSHMKMNNPVLNTQLPACLADLAAELGVPVFLLSTEYVWTGAENGPHGYPAVEIGQDRRFVWETGAAPYALQKAEAEHLALQKRVRIKDGDSVTVIRVPVLYGPMLNKLEDGTASASINNFLGENSFRHDTWQRRYPTSAKDAAFTICALASKRLRPEGLQRTVYHYGAQESVSKFEFMSRFLEAAELPVDELRAEDASERAPERQPPFDVRLDIDATRQELTAVDDWREPRHIGAETIQQVWMPHFDEEIAAQRARTEGPSMKPSGSSSQEPNADGAALLESDAIQDQGEDCHAMPMEVANGEDEVDAEKGMIAEEEEEEEEMAQLAKPARKLTVARDALFTLASPEADGGMLDKDCKEFVELALHRFTSLEDAFIWMDVNRSGSLSMSEFLLLVRDVHFHGDVHKLWSVLDRNNNGLVSLHEFMSLHALQPAINAPQGLPPPSPCKQDKACVPLAVLEGGHDALFVGAPEGVFHCGDDLAELELSEGDAEERVRRDARHGSLELSEGDDEENASFGDEGAKGCMSEEPEPLEQVATPLRRRSGAAVGFEL